MLYTMTCLFSSSFSPKGIREFVDNPLTNFIIAIKIIQSKIISMQNILVFDILKKLSIFQLILQLINRQL